MPVHLNTNEIMSVIVLASPGTFPKCPEGGKVGLLVFQTSGLLVFQTSRYPDPEHCQLASCFAVREVSHMGIVSSPKQQPGECGYEAGHRNWLTESPCQQEGVGHRGNLECHSQPISARKHTALP